MNRKILALAIPNIITNISIPLLAMVDLGLMGHLESEMYVGAIALGGMIFSFIFWGFGFLRMSTSGFTAQAYGMRDLPEASAVLIRGLFTALLSGFILVMLQWPIAWIAFHLIDSSQEVENLAKTYFHIRIYAAPATLVLYVLTGWFIGMQNARIPMILAIAVNVLNVVLSVIFIRTLGMHVNGVAWANLLSQYLGLFLGLGFISLYWTKMKKHLHLSGTIRWSNFQQFIHVNKNIFIRTLCLIFTLSFFTVQSAKSGDIMLAVNTLLFQFFYFFSYFADGYAYAAEALTGKYIGAGDQYNLRKLVRLLFQWAGLLAGMFTIVYLLLGNHILSMLTNNREVLQVAESYFIWVILVPFVTFSAFVWDGIYVGATASKAMRNSMVIITTVIFLPAYYFLEPLMGNHGLWLAMMLFMGARGIFLKLLFKRDVLVKVSGAFKSKL